MTTNKRRPSEINIADIHLLQKSVGWGTTAQSSSFKEVFERIAVPELKSRIANDN